MARKKEMQFWIVQIGSCSRSRRGLISQLPRPASCRNNATVQDGAAVWVRERAVRANWWTKRLRHDRQRAALRVIGE